MLRQNPHNVHEWHKRVKLFDGQPERQIKVFAEAVATVDPDKVQTPDCEEQSAVASASVQQRSHDTVPSICT